MPELELKETITKADTILSNLRKGPRKSIKERILPFAIAAIAAGVLGAGIRSRMHAEADLRTVTAQTAVPSVAVAYPKPAAPVNEIILPGSIVGMVVGYATQKYGMTSATGGSG